MTRPTRRALLLLAAGLPVAALPMLFHGRFAALSVAWLAATALLLGIDAALALRRGEWRVDVVVPDTLFLGDADPLRVELLALRPSLVKEVELRCDLDELFVPADSIPLAVGEDGAARAEIPLAPRRRGRGHVDALWLRWRGPLALIERTLRHRLDRAVPVVPNVRAVRQAAMKLSRASASWAGRKPERYVGDGSEFDSLREYAPGFDPRTIDWKASARHQKLLARELRAERNHQLVLALDCGTRMREPIDGLSRLDRGVNAALLLAWVGVKHGDRVGLFAFDSHPRAFEPPRAGHAAFDRLRRQTAELFASTEASNYTLGLTHLAQKLPRRALIVLFTDFADSIGAELLVENVARLAKRHVVLFVALKDPELERIALAEPRAAPDLFRAVAAEELLRDRADVLQRVARLGVHVIDARAADVTSRLINVYLEMKRRELVA
jgi:uncharacterized protein (DUF58 family)